MSLPEMRECNEGSGGQEGDSNQSPQGSGLHLFCRLAYFNCSQAFTQTEVGFSVLIYVGGCVSESRRRRREGEGGVI